MKRLSFIAIVLSVISGFGLSAFSQDTPTPIPPVPTLAGTPVQIDEGCVIAGISYGSGVLKNLITNGDFQYGLPDLSRVGLSPSFWSNGVFVVDPTKTDQETQLRGMAMLRPGMTMSQTPRRETQYLRFRISFCALAVNGQITVTMGGTYVTAFPAISAAGVSTSAVMENVNGNVDLMNNPQQYPLKFTFTAVSGMEDSAVAYIDNVLLQPILEPAQESPTPKATTTLEPSPTKGTPTQIPTKTPTMLPGLHTPTPTPGLYADSIKMVVNPPMLITSPDDFSNSSVGSRKQAVLDFDVRGTNGEPIDIAKIDPDAKIRFIIDVRGELQDIGTLSIPSGEAGVNFESISKRQLDLKDLMGDTIYFFPLKPYTGTARIIATIEYKTETKSDSSGGKEDIKIQGVVPIYLRTSPDASLTQAIGTFNPILNSRLNRLPGDRGYKPIDRNNVFFREKLGK